MNDKSVFVVNYVTDHAQVHEYMSFSDLKALQQLQKDGRVVIMNQRLIQTSSREG